MYWRYPDGGDFFFEIDESEIINFEELVDFEELIDFDENYRDKDKKYCNYNKNISCEKHIKLNKEYPIDLKKWLKTDDEYANDITSKKHSWYFY